MTDQKLSDNLHLFADHVDKLIKAKEAIVSHIQDASLSLSENDVNAYARVFHDAVGNTILAASSFHRIANDVAQNNHGMFLPFNERQYFSFNYQIPRDFVAEMHLALAGKDYASVPTTPQTMTSGGQLSTIIETIEKAATDQKWPDSLQSHIADFKQALSDIKKVGATVESQGNDWAVEIKKRSTT